LDKLIFHIDVNSAFLSWEAAYRVKEGDKVDLRDIPSAIGGDDVKGMELFWQNQYLQRNLISKQVNPFVRH
jgi:hypothetical protein